MAQEIMLEVYTFQVRKSGKRGNYIDLSTFPKASADFYAFMHHYITHFQTEPMFNPETQKAIMMAKTNRHYDDSNRMVSGILDYGDFGKEGNIIDITGKVNYKKKKGESDVQPFYFLVYTPPNSNMGYVVLERNGVHGINSVFTSGIVEKFDSLYADHTLDISALVSKELAKNIAAKGAIREIVLKRNNLPSDIADSYGNKNILDGNIKNVKIVITVANSKLLGETRAKSFLNDNSTSFFTIPIDLKKMGFDGNHKTSIKVEIKGKIRTIDMSSSGLIKPYFDVTDDVSTLASGHPKFTSINDVAKKLILDITSK